MWFHTVRGDVATPRKPGEYQVKLIRTSVAAAVALIAAAPMIAHAEPIATGFTSTTLAANDDNYTGAVSLGFSANFFGNTYTSTYVSNNGYITFGGGQGSYTPTGLGSGYSGNPIIAAFYADVDTRGEGSALLSYGTGSYAGRNAFAATWNGVGYYSAQDDKLNSFQLILTDRSDTGSGNFDIYFNYDSILWETGSASGGTNGFGGTSAGVGYNAGTGLAGTYYELPGSRVPGSFLNGGSDPLVLETNNNVLGQLYFQVRNGVVVTPGVPEPATWAMMIFGFGAAGTALRRRRKVTTTVRFA